MTRPRYLRSVNELSLLNKKVIHTILFYLNIKIYNLFLYETGMFKIHATIMTPDQIITFNTFKLF